ncbi:unnamed protein product [Cylindrotheca closterium]|uniref:Uncharacterized protein n=1 Tax=Cylindrotheca closterium TaxID=2856 RepID=A0AAD2CTN1_9STRA|nr:unnamed protein product [Cylindrotheca closterium]
MSIALDKYFAALKLETGMSNFTIVQDRALRRRISPTPKQNNPQQALRDALTKTSASKFSMDECDEPLYCPTRRLSSAGLGSASESLSSDSLGALVNIDDSYRTPPSSKDEFVFEQAADSRWSSATLQKKHDHLMHSRVSSRISRG